MIMIIWLTFFVDNYFSLSLYKFGLYPLSFKGLTGVLTMPLIHGDIGHIINNSVPLIILITFLFNFYTPHFKQIFFLIWITSGLWTWMFARPSYHIGASGLIYGLAAFIFFAGIIIKEKKHIALSLLVVFLYGSIVWGMFPINFMQSWEGHLSGFLSGMTFAYFYRKELKEKYLPPDPYPEEEDDDDDDPYWKTGADENP